MFVRGGAPPSTVVLPARYMELAIKDIAWKLGDG